MFSVNAAPVAINSMFVDYASATLDVNGASFPPQRLSVDLILLMNGNVPLII